MDGKFKKLSEDDYLTLENLMEKVPVLELGYDR